MEERFDFKFELDQEVVTPFGEDGLVEMLGFDDGGRKYYVRTANNASWFKEGLLRIGVVYLVEDFLGTVCSKNTEGMTSARDLYAAFVDYCKGNDFKVASMRGFDNRLHEIGFAKIKKEGLFFWLGLSLPEAA